MAADGWECSQSRFVDYPAVALSLLKRVRARWSPSIYGNIRVIYVCGADHADKCGLGHGIDRDIDVAVMPRPGYTVRNVNPQLYGRHHMLSPSCRSTHHCMDANIVAIW